MKTKDKKNLFKAFILFFLLAFLIINWEDVSWIFNYRIISNIFAIKTDSSRQTDISSAKAEEDNIEENKIEEEKEQKSFDYTERENSLEIPKIGISAPIVLGATTDPIKLKGELDKGVVLYPNSVLPGEEGQTVLLGHSAPAGWPKIKHDWVFSEINNLEQGDFIYLYYNNKKYNYRIETKGILERGEEIPQEGLTNYDRVLVLVSCWPPGKDYKRIFVGAKMIDN